MEAKEGAKRATRVVSEAQGDGSGRFSRYAWCVLVYILGVILFGAWVRITGSGAGCGEHWPTCHGEVIPRSPSAATVIEYTHRVTSGLLGPMALVLCVWAYRLPGRRPAVRVAALLTLVFIVLEGLLGAGLVLGELVADDDSVARAVVIALHLGNTLVLTASGALTAFFGARRQREDFRIRSPQVRPLLFAAAAVVLVSASGAVTALGDTLFPVLSPDAGSTFAHLKGDLAPGAHFLKQLRVVHPILAVSVGLALAFYCQRLAARLGTDGKLATLCAGMTWLQLVMGALNIMLRAPGAMQLAHLLGAQILWISLVLLIAQRAALSVGQASEPQGRRLVAEPGQGSGSL